MSLDKQRITKIKEELGLNNSATFCGFVIYIPVNDEFIGQIQENIFGKVIGYVPIPNYAIKFNRYVKAIKAAKKCDKYKTVIGFLFDLGEQHYLGFEK